MIKTNSNNKNDITNINNKPKVTEGFINGKLFRGDVTGNKSTKKTKNNNIHKVDFKQKGYKYKSSHNNDNPGAIFKKAALSIIIGIVATIISIYLINMFISEISSSSNSNEDNEMTNDVQEERLSDFEIINPEQYDSEDETVYEDNDNNDFDIPGPILDDLNELDEEADSNNIEEVDTTDEILGSNIDDNDGESNISNRGNLGIDEAIFYYAKKDGEYGLVGYPLNNEIKSQGINEKIRILAKELLRNPQGDALTMIPDGTEFLGFRLVGKTIYLNYSEEFNYNIYGVEGDIQQLAQIIYTFTSLDEIDKVAFLIEGNNPSSIGNHGIQNKEWTEEEIASLM
jgi:hypothetical protein